MRGAGAASRAKAEREQAGGRHPPSKGKVPREIIAVHPTPLSRRHCAEESNRTTRPLAPRPKGASLVGNSTQHHRSRLRAPLPLLTRSSHIVTDTSLLSTLPPRVWTGREAQVEATFANTSTYLARNTRSPCSFVAATPNLRATPTRQGQSAIHTLGMNGHIP